MNLLKTRLGLDEFILEMMGVSSAQLHLDHLQDWVARLDLKPDLFDRHLSFCPQTYQRKLLCRTPRFDMLILCWQSGQASSIHDHIDSLNVTRVYRGMLTSRSYERCHSKQGTLEQSRLVSSCEFNSTSVPVRLKAEEQLSSGHLAVVDRHEIHQLANTTDENLVTLHVYARPLQKITIYSPTSGQPEQVAVQYSLREDEQ